MSVSHRYRDFGDTKLPVDDVSEQNEALEDQKLQAFEAGYQAGWDDAVKAQSDAKDKISAELGQNLLDMSFTYHEALSKLTLSLEPTMQQIIEKLLPDILRTALGAQIVEQLQNLLKSHMGRPVEIVVKPQNVNAVQAILDGKISEPFAIVPEASLGEGQAFIRIGESEQQVDLDTVVSEISKAMDAFFYEAVVEADNGKP